MKFDGLKSEYLPQMAQIEKEAFDQPWSENAFMPDLADENAFYAVGVKDGEVICYGGFHRVLDEGQIANIAVRADYRGKGYGKRLMRELINIAKRNGINRMTLEVKDTNERAVNLYKSFGFTVEGVRRKYYLNRYDALVMWLSVEED